MENGGVVIEGQTACNFELYCSPMMTLSRLSLSLSLRGMNKLGLPATEKPSHKMIDLASNGQYLDL